MAQVTQQKIGLSDFKNPAIHLHQHVDDAAQVIRKVKRKTVRLPKCIGMNWRSVAMSRAKIIENTKSYHDELIESLRKPKEADLYLRIAMDEYHEDGDIEALLVALRNIAEAKGGMAQLAKKTRLNRQNLYHVLSKKGNPRLDTLELILRGLGYKLAIQPDETRKAG